MLSHPERVLVVYVPIRRENGKLEVFEGYRVQHNSLLGPYKGGIRFHPEVTLADDMALALLMTLKNSLAGLPYGGGKGAMQVKNNEGTLRPLPGTEQLSSPEEVLYQDVDILIPAALEDTTYAGNVHRIKARVIVEGANGPVTPEADAVLHEAGVVIVPDILANAGGVTVSYLEWVDNLQWYRHEEAEIQRRLETIMTRSFDRVYERQQQQGITLREAAAVTALQRLHRAAVLRGVL